MATDEVDLVELLAEHELALARLYGAFAMVLAGHRELWERLSLEEENHAAMLRTLSGDLEVNRWLLHDSGVKPFAVKSSMDHVENTITRTRAGGLSSLQALSIARDMETALIEEQFSRMSPALDLAIGSLIGQLAEDTERHRRSIIEILEVERRGGI